MRAARPAANPYSIGDGTGLFLHITPAGGKLWRSTYEHNCKEKLMSFGAHPVISLAAARESHSAAKALLPSRVDPMAEHKRLEAEQDDPNQPKKMSLRALSHFDSSTGEMIAVVRSDHPLLSILRRLLRSDLIQHMLVTIEGAASGSLKHQPRLPA